MAEENTNNESAESKTDNSNSWNIFNWVENPKEVVKNLRVTVAEELAAVKGFAVETGDELRDMYDVMSEIVRDAIPSAVTALTPLDREIAKYYVTDQGPGDFYKRWLAYSARGRALEKKRKKGTLNQYQVDNLENMLNFMNDTRIKNAFSFELQGQKDRWNKLTTKEKTAGPKGTSLTLQQAWAERLKKNPLGKPKTPEDIRERLKLIFMGETQLGQRDKTGKLIDPPGGAVGLLQITPETFWSVAAAGGKKSQFGTEATKASGLEPADLTKIRKMTLPLTVKNKETLTKYLKKPEVNYMVAAAKIFEYLTK